MRSGHFSVHKWSCFPTQILVFPDVANLKILQWYKEVHGATFDYKYAIFMVKMNMQFYGFI